MISPHHTKVFKPIFKDQQLQSLFEDNGFVKIPLLNLQEVNILNALFESTSTQHEKKSTLHHTTTDTQNPELIYKVDEAIKSVFLPKLEKILTNFNALVGCFHIKEPGGGSETGIHQDPTFVDETKYYSANVWVALQNIDKKNGNLFFVNGSNRVVTSLRVTPEFPSYYDSFSESLPEMVTHVPLKAGEAVIFNNATIHGATENLSDRIRLASTLLICSAPADWLLYYRDKNLATNEIEKYQLNLHTFISIPKNGRPDKKAFKEFITYEFPQVTKDEFLKRVRRTNGKGVNYLQMLKSIFRKKGAE